MVVTVEVWKKLIAEELRVSFWLLALFIIPESLTTTSRGLKAF